MPVDKSFFQNAESLVLESLQGLTVTNPELIFNKHTKAIIHAHHDPTTQVSLIAGGGAGHEPSHAAFVGKGMLSAAVSGNIFASPSVSQILQTIRAVGGPAGTILIVKNYTGDIFHFNLAAERARALYGLKVDVIVVDDDVSVGRARNGKVGRRGLAGTVLVHKILGAMARAGKPMNELAQMGRKVAENLATCGVSQGHVCIPGNVPPQAEDQMELGMGIHNEPGCYVLNPRPSLDDLLEKMFDFLLDSKDTDRGYVSFEGATNVVLLVNNLGGVSVLELSAITLHASSQLKSRGIHVTRVLSGTFMTSLNAAGFSITLLKATPDMVEYIDTPTSAIGWPQPYSHFQPYQDQRVIESQGDSDGAKSPKSEITTGPKVNIEDFRRTVRNACNSLKAAESVITQYDSIVGDGDCGSTLKRGAEAVLKVLSEDLSDNAGANVLKIAHAIEGSMDGTSGALFELFFNAMASELRDMPGPLALAGVREWASAALGALEALKRVTPARPGDRTLMDALVPFIEDLNETANLSGAVEAARPGRDRTKGMQASLGRAVYVSGDAWGKVPDPGAEGVVAIVAGLDT